jgi:hypothetical protein
LRCQTETVTTNVVVVARNPRDAISPHNLAENRRDIGKSQSIWTDSKMETAGSPQQQVLVRAHSDCCCRCCRRCVSARLPLLAGLCFVVQLETSQ